MTTRNESPPVPERSCGICGAPLRFVIEPRRVGGRRREDLVIIYGPTAWRQMPHRCPPEVMERIKQEVNANAAARRTR